MIRCLAIDDEPLALAQLKSYIEKISFLQPIAFCSSAFEAMQSLSDYQTDLIITDIQMPDLNGLDFIKSLPVSPLVIFTTAYSEYAIEGFRINAADYLLKPFGYADFLKAVNKARQILQWRQYPSELPEQPEPENEERYLFVKADYKIIRIEIEQISYIESMSEYVRIHTTTAQKPVTTLLSLKTLEEKLPVNKFMRIHRSFIVNLKKVVTISKGQIQFDNRIQIPVGNQYRDRLNRYIERFLIGKKEPV